MRELEVVNAANTGHLETYKAFLYDRLQRKGFDQQDIHRLAARDRHVFAALMLAHGHGDGHGHRRDAQVGACAGADQPRLRRRVPRTARSASPRCCTRAAIVLIADTLVHEWPDEEDLADIAERGAPVARGLGLEPRVAFLSLLDLRLPGQRAAEKMHRRAEVLDARGVDFEYEGEMTVDVALNPRARWRTIRSAA